MKRGIIRRVKPPQREERPALPDRSGSAEPSGPVGFSEAADSSDSPGSSGNSAPPSIPKAAPDAVPPAPVTSSFDDGANDDEPFLRMSLREHLLELRTRIIRCVIGIFICFLGMFYFAPLVRVIMEAAVKSALPPDGSLTFADFTEPFLIDMHIALVMGFFVASPYIFYQIWAFIAPGLYDTERKYVVPVAVASAFFFILGGAFCYFVVIPFSVSFFIGYGSETGSAKPLITIANTYRFILRLILVFGLMFEMPLFTLFLARFRILTAARMRAWRKYAILAIFIIAAVITPPDVLTQLLLAGPLILLYELSIWVAAFAAPARKKQEEPAPAPADGS